MLGGGGYVRLVTGTPPTSGGVQWRTVGSPFGSRRPFRGPASARLLPGGGIQRLRKLAGTRRPCRGAACQVFSSLLLCPRILKVLPKPNQPGGNIPINTFFQTIMISHHHCRLGFYSVQVGSQLARALSGWAQFPALRLHCCGVQHIHHISFLKGAGSSFDVVISFHPLLGGRCAGASWPSRGQSIFSPQGLSHTCRNPQGPPARGGGLYIRLAGVLTSLQSISLLGGEPRITVD